MMYSREDLEVMINDIFFHINYEAYKKSVAQDIVYNIISDVSNPSCELFKYIISEDFERNMEEKGLLNVYKDVQQSPKSFIEELVAWSVFHNDADTIMDIFFNEEVFEEYFLIDEYISSNGEDDSMISDLERFSTGEKPIELLMRSIIDDRQPIYDYVWFIYDDYPNELVNKYINSIQR